MINSAKLGSVQMNSWASRRILSGSRHLPVHPCLLHLLKGPHSVLKHLLYLANE